MWDWLRRRARPPEPHEEPAKVQRPRLLAPGGVPYTSHEELLRQVEEDRRRLAGEEKGPRWELVYRHKGKLFREIIPLSQAANEGEIIGELYKRGVKMEHINSLERKE